MELVSITYQESRLAFFKEQLAAAKRRLDWSIKHDQNNWYDLAEKGEVVSFYEWAVKMAENSTDKEFCDGIFEPSCNKCIHKDACEAWIRHGLALYDDFSFSTEDCPYYEDIKKEDCQ